MSGKTLPGHEFIFGSTRHMKDRSPALSFHQCISRIISGVLCGYYSVMVLQWVLAKLQNTWPLISLSVMQTLYFVSGLHNCLEFSQPLSCLSTENVPYCLNICIHVPRFDFICVPICHPRYRREFLDPVPNRSGAFTRSDLVLPSQGK